MSASSVTAATVEVSLLVLVVVSPSRLGGGRTTTSRDGGLIGDKQDCAQGSKSYMDGSVAGIIDILCSSG